MNEVLAQAAARTAVFKHPLMEARPVRKRAVILVSTDRGLCGALNSNLFREAAKFDQDHDGVHHRRAQGGAIHRAHETPARRRVHLQGHAAIRRGAGHFQIRAGYVPQGRGGRRGHFVHQFHFDARSSSRRSLPFLPIGKIRAVTAGVHSACGREESARAARRWTVLEFEPDEKTVLGAAAAAQPEFPDAPDFAGGQGQRTQRAHGGDEERHRQRAATHQGPDARIQQIAPVEHHEGIAGNCHRADGGGLENHFAYEQRQNRSNHRPGRGRGISRTSCPPSTTR